MTQTTLGRYVLALGGFALLRRWYEQTSVTEARYDELLDLAVKAADDDELLQLVLNTQEFEVREGYTRWSETYDGPNPLIETEEDVCNPMLNALPRTTLADRRSMRAAGPGGSRGRWWTWATT